MTMHRTSGLSMPSGNGNGNGIKLFTGDKSQCCKLCNTMVGAGDKSRVEINNIIFHFNCLQDRLRVLNINTDLQYFFNRNRIVPERVCSFLNDNFETIVWGLNKKNRTIDKLLAAENISNIILNCVIQKNKEFKTIRKELNRVRDVANLLDSFFYGRKNLNEIEKLTKKFILCIQELEELELA
ncbi:MAG: hypothetical protein V1865_01090 [bacterium]